MGELGALRFDKTSVDCELAKKYLEKNFTGCHLYGPPKEYIANKWVADNYGSKIYYTCPSYITYLDTITFEPCPKRAEILVKLANKIEENAELFCQLEALIRNLPKEDVRNCDIKLIVQNLLCSSTNMQNKGPYWPYIYMTDELPLAMLGYVAQLVMTGDGYVVILASRNTFVVCHLFKELCHKVGLKSVNVAFFEESCRLVDFIQEKVDLHLQTGSTGVITSCSDVDSAVDALLSSTTKYPWKLRRLLVQESVYDSVKNVFDWKCKLKQPENDMDYLKQSCTYVFVNEDKIFLFDYAGESVDIKQQEKQVILVEAYRTMKELLSLLAQYNSGYLALWSNDVAEANEISVNVSSNIVWLNNFGTFDGPPKASRGFFSLMENCYFMTSRIPESNDINKLLKLHKAWMKLDVSQRVAMVKKSLENVQKILGHSVFKNSEDFENCTTVDFSNQLDNFVHVHDGKMCIGINKSFITCLTSKMDHDFSKYATKVVRLLINGTAILVLNDRSSLLFEKFAEDGLPVVVTASEVKLGSGNVLVSLDEPFSVTKVVYQQYGTIFAN